jgi:hypothetical protein
MRAAARILGEGGHHLWGASHTNYFLLTPERLHTLELIFIEGAAQRIVSH